MATKTEKIKAENPWKEIIKKAKDNKYKLKRNQNYFYEKDEELIAKFNDKETNEKYKLHLNILPYHFSGNILDAPIMLLTANPGYVKSEEENGFYTGQQFIKENIEHLNFERELLLLDSEVRKSKSPYYYNKLRELISKYDFDKVSRNISLLQFFPYQSKNFKKTALLPSQLFGFKIVRYAIQQKKVIVIMRSEKYWYDAVNELKKYPNKVVLKSYLNPCLTERNCQPNDFQKILNKLDRCPNVLADKKQ